MQPSMGRRFIGQEDAKNHRRMCRHVAFWVIPRIAMEMVYNLSFLQY